MGMRGPDKKKRKTRRRSQCPDEITSIHEHVEWYGDEGGFHPHGVDEPTEECPGTQRKLEVLRERVDRGQGLWQPEDIKPDLK